MLRVRQYASGWRGALLIALTYTVFLIFAQFAFLNRLNELGIAAGHLKFVMASMAVGGIAFSFLTPRPNAWASAILRVRVGFFVLAAAAFLALLPLQFTGALVLAALVGAGLAILTVTLAAHLREWTGSCNPLLVIGFGTGVGYLLSNFPPLFAASPEVQSNTAGALCIFGLCLPLTPSLVNEPSPQQSTQDTHSFVSILAAFTALVWLDSAAFFIIQNSSYLKAGTWQGAHLWVIGLLHFAAAIAGGWFLNRSGVRPVLIGAFLFLGSACVLLLSPAGILPASALYPVGVSLYSAALVAYPSVFFGGSADDRGRVAGWLYAIAGWIGSALGIGMGQNLGYVPLLFVALAGLVIVSPPLVHLLRRRWREVVLVGAVALVSAVVSLVERAPTSSQEASAVERGRQVYISEGCINCHSQYVRPGSPDVLMWGPTQTISQIRLNQPPLIGNRRQGPDLSEVGARRSALWLKAHLIAPAEVSGASVMPSYELLFHDNRGDDLVAYLASLGGDKASEHEIQEKSWVPSVVDRSAASLPEGALLYERFCATCHEANGKTRIAWLDKFHHQPADLRTGPYLNIDPGKSRSSETIDIERITKFGIAGTDMPGHEYLSDEEIESIALWVAQQIEQAHARL